VLQQYIDEQSVTPLALNYDFGLITLASPAPNGTTTINIAAGEGSSVKYTLQTAGYPADEKPAQTMWQVTLPLVQRIPSAERRVLQRIMLNLRSRSSLASPEASTPQGPTACQRQACIGEAQRVSGHARQTHDDVLAEGRPRAVASGPLAVSDASLAAAMRRWTAPR